MALRFPNQARDGQIYISGGMSYVYSAAYTFWYKAPVTGGSTPLFPMGDSGYITSQNYGLWSRQRDDLFFTFDCQTSPSGLDTVDLGYTT